MNSRLRQLLELGGPGAPARYLTDTETLRLTVFNAAASVRVALRGRLIDEHGESKFASNEKTPTTDRTANTVDVIPGAGWLVGCAALVVAGAPADGQTYAVISIGIGIGANFTETEVLAAGTITSAKRITWPGGSIVGPLDSAGAIRSISGTTPAAGAEISETVPTGASWELLALAFTLTTAVAVANRAVQLVIDDGANILFRNSMNVNEIASLVYNYQWVQGFGNAVISQIFALTSIVPSIARLNAGFRIRTVTGAIQAADQFSLVQLWVRERIEGA